MLVALGKLIFYASTARNDACSFYNPNAQQYRSAREGEEITNKGQMDGVGWPLYFHLGAIVCVLINYIPFARLTIASHGVVHLKLI